MAGCGQGPSRTGGVRPAEDDRNIRYLAHMKFEFLRFAASACGAARGVGLGHGIAVFLQYTYCASQLCPWGRPWCGLGVQSDIRYRSFLPAWHLLTDTEGHSPETIGQITLTGDPRIVVHPIISMVLYTVWSKVVFISFVIGKVWFILTLAIYGLRHPLTSSCGSRWPSSGRPET